MSLRSGGPLRGQDPRVSRVPRSVRSDAADAAFLADAYGLTPDPWQRLVLEGWLGRLASGRWAALSCGLAVPRQNGKNGVLEMRELFGMVELGERFLHTAHEVKTARKAFVRLKSFFENPAHPELQGLVKEIRHTNGQEAIVLDNGGSCEFIARSKSSGRGYTVDILVCDEAQELSDEALEALMPTTTAAPLRNPQWIFTGTPPGPTANGEVFTRLRDDGVSGKDRRLCWLEWSVEGDVDLDDRRLWYATNPGLDVGRLVMDVCEGERERYLDEGFARERLGMWASLRTTAVIDPELWAQLATSDDNFEQLTGPVFALDVTPDRAASSVAVAAKRPDGSWEAELVRHEPGVSWVADFVADVIHRRNAPPPILDAAGPAGGLIPALSELGVEPRLVSARELGQACGLFYDTVQAHQLRHRDQPELNTALGAAAKRPLGDAWAWKRKDTTDISPLVAVTLALHGAATTKPVEPRSRAAFGF